MAIVVASVAIPHPQPHSCPAAAADSVYASHSAAAFTSFSGLAAAIAVAFDLVFMFA